MKPEFEIINLTCNRLREVLKGTYRGYVKVWVKDDMLEVSIENDGFIFKYYEPNYIDYVVDKGIEPIISSIDKEFKKALMGKYFKEKEETNYGF